MTNTKTANLGFTIENRAGADILVWKEGGCRPATSAEIAMWKALSAAQQPVVREQQAPSAAAADTVVLEAALRAIHQAIDLIGEPDTERLRTVRRVLRGAVIVAEDAGEAATAPQPAPAPLSDDAVKDAARWRMVALIGNEVMLHPEKRTQAAAVKAYMDATHSGLELTGAVDAALAAHGGKV